MEELKMKRLSIITLLFAVVATMFAACSKNSAGTTEEIVIPVNKIEAEIIANAPASRIVVGEKVEGEGYPITWSEEGEEIAVLEFVDGVKPSEIIKSKGYELSNDNKVARFSYDLTEASEEATLFDYYACYPHGVVRESFGTENYMALNLEGIQTQKVEKLGQIDSNAAIIIAASKGHESQQTSLEMSFRHVMAYAKMALKGLESNEVVESVTFSTTDEANPLSASTCNCYYNGDITPSGTKHFGITIDTPDTAADTTGKLENIWFASLPCSNLANFTVAVETSKNSYTKTWDLSATDKKLSLTKSQVSTFTANMTGAEKIAKVGEWTRVRNAAILEEYFEVIIVAADSDVAMSTTQNSNNRAQTEVVKNGQYVIDQISDEVQIFELHKGNKENTWAFYDGTGYIYAANSSNNYLRTEEILSDNSSWTVEVNNDVAAVVAQGENTRNTLRYNGTSNIFSCYAPENTMKDIAIYYRRPSIEPQITSFTVEPREFESEGGEAVATVTMKYAAGQTLTVTRGENDWISISENSINTDGNISTATINVTVAANESEEPRTATLTASLGNGASREFTISQKAFVPASVAHVYTKVTENLSDFSGQYLIVYEGSNAAFDGSLATLDATSNYKTVTIEDSTITLAPNEDTFYFTITKTANGYSIQSVGGKYIGRTANTNELDESTTTKYDNTISHNGTSTDIKGSGGAYLRFNKTSGQTRFRYFKSDSYTSQEAIQLYQLNGSGAAPALTAPANVKCTAQTENSLTITWEAVANATGYQVSSDGSTWVDANGNLTHTFSDLEVGTEYTLSVKAKGDGENYSDSLAATCTASTSGIKPSLTVTPTTLDWEADATDAKAINVEATHSWTHSASGMDWATITVSSKTITVTPKAANTSETANEGSITISMDGVENVVVNCSQAGATQSGGDDTETTVTHDFKFTTIGSTGWSSSYASHTAEFDEATVTFSSASKQTTNITTMPVTKGQPVTLVAKNGATIKSATFKCAQWTTRTQTITLHYSTNGGSSYTTTGVTSTNFSISKSDLPAGTNAVKITFSSSSNQVGVESATITYTSGGNSGGDTPATPTQLVMSDITCTAQTENSLTFSWSAVANATGYQVSTNGGTSYGATQAATTYTWTGLSASTQKTIYVKAIGDGTTYTDSAAKSANGTTSAAQGGGSSAKTYSFTIIADNFPGNSYANNNNEKTSTATATDGSGDTMEVKWTSYQVMKQSNAIQFQKNVGYIYNSTDLGTIDNITITSTAGTYTKYIGSSAQPSTTNGTGGYFKIKETGNVTGKVSQIQITFTK